MTTTTPPSPPPEVLAYLAAPAPEAAQFDFLLGRWQVRGRRFGPAGEQAYGARWHAWAVHDGRMVVDDFTVCAPDGRAVTGFVTLRTWSPANGCWEIAGMGVHQPAVQARWTGRFVDGEMHLVAEGTAPDGRPFRSRIRFHAIERDRFAWENHVSVDGGAQWHRVGELVATRES